MSCLEQKALENACQQKVFLLSSELSSDIPSTLLVCNQGYELLVEPTRHRVWEEIFLDQAGFYTALMTNFLRIRCDI